MNISTGTQGNLDDVEYTAFLDRLQTRFNSVTDPLFSTGVYDLYNTFLSILPEDQRQFHNCNACRNFVNTYGGLVTIDESGNTHSALWHVEDAPEMYKNALRLMTLQIKDAQVTGVFYSSKPVWGQPVTGIWTHLAVSPTYIHAHPIQSADQAMAERHEDFRMLSRALSNYRVNDIVTAVSLLKTESLYRSEKCLGVAEWLLDLKIRLSKIEHRHHRQHLIWKVVASAPTGYCHVHSSMIGTLLDDLATGMDFALVSRRFADKMHPLQYQRPQAAPAAGNIDQAEKLVATLGIEKALRRRFARLEEIHTIWRPTEIETKHEGVFGHLKQQAPQKRVQVPITNMTWMRFQRDVLPIALEIRFFVPRDRANYCALVTAVDPDAPLIFQWDNPVSWYVYNGGSPAEQWGLRSGDMHTVTAISMQPSMWERPREHQGTSVIFILDGAKDSYAPHSSAALFPEILKSELRAVRSTIEAFSNSTHVEDLERASACGIRLHKGQQWNAHFQVVSTDEVTYNYTLDRWE